MGIVVENVTNADGCTCISITHNQGFVMYIMTLILVSHPCTCHVKPKQKQTLLLATDPLPRLLPPRRGCPLLPFLVRLNWP